MGFAGSTRETGSSTADTSIPATRAEWPRGNQTQAIRSCGENLHLPGAKFACSGRPLIRLAQNLRSPHFAEDSAAGDAIGKHQKRVWPLPLSRTGGVWRFGSSRRSIFSDGCMIFCAASLRACRSFPCSIHCATGGAEIFQNFAGGPARCANNEDAPELFCSYSRLPSLRRRLQGFPRQSPLSAVLVQTQANTVDAEFLFCPWIRDSVDELRRLIQ